VQTVDDEKTHGFGVYLNHILFCWNLEYGGFLFLNLERHEEMQQRVGR